MGVGPHEGFKLRLFGAYLQQAFGHTAYQVGSSLTQKGGWRDVDVRLLLPDDEFAAYFGDPMKPGWDSNKKGLWDWAWTTFGRKTTDLPIDFQIQSVTLANNEFDGPRSALMILDTDFAVTRTGRG